MSDTPRYTLRSSVAAIDAAVQDEILSAPDLEDIALANGNSIPVDCICMAMAAMEMLRDLLNTATPDAGAAVKLAADLADAREFGIPDVEVVDVLLRRYAAAQLEAAASLTDYLNRRPPQEQSGE